MPATLVGAPLTLLGTAVLAAGGAGFTPVRLGGGDRGEMGEAEVGHGARDCADGEGSARRDEDDGDAVALVRGEQGMILEPGRESRR